MDKKNRLQNALRAAEPVHCRRCGSCCMKGGPAFHLEDRELIEKGILQTRDLFTIRKGEPVWNNVNGRQVIAATSELIKIKGKDGSWTCRFYDDGLSGCTIYEKRPLECRVLKCWDTDEIERIYSRQRLSRRDLLSGIRGLWELIEDHELRCGYEKLERLTTAGADAEISEMYRYDLHLRRLVVEKGHLDSEMTDFLFGRPMGDVLKPKNRRPMMENQ